MEALRRIVRSDVSDLHIKIPNSFLKHKLEVIVIKTEDIKPKKNKRKADKKRPEVGTITSKSVVLNFDVFKPLNDDELKDWGLN